MPDDNRTEPDERWPLLRELDHAFWEQTDPDEQERRWDSVRWISSDYDFRNSPVRGEAVHIFFDYRMSQGELSREIARLWREWSRFLLLPSRRFDLKRRRIVELVCLKRPDADWPERMKAWNQSYSQREEWQYDHPSRLKRDFERAERRLTGNQRGLAWYYDPDVRARRAVNLHNALEGDRENEELWEELCRELEQAGRHRLARLCRARQA